MVRGGVRHRPEDEFQINTMSDNQLIMEPKENIEIKDIEEDVYE